MSASSETSGKTEAPAPSTAAGSSYLPEKPLTRSQAAGAITKIVALPMGVQKLREIAKLSAPTYYTKMDIPCDLCGVKNERTKAICTACGKLLHLACAVGLDKDVLAAGKWQCQECKDAIIELNETVAQIKPNLATPFSPSRSLQRTPPTEASSNTSTSHLQNQAATIEDISHINLTGNDDIGTESTRRTGDHLKPSPGSQHSSRVSRISAKEQLRLLEIEQQIAQKRFERMREEEKRREEQMREEEKRREERMREENQRREERILQEEAAALRHLAKQRDILEGSKGGSERSNKSSVDNTDSIDRWVSEQIQARNRRIRDQPNLEQPNPETKDADVPPIPKPKNKDATLPWLGHNISQAEFLERTLVGNNSARGLNLSRSQVQARYVIPKELPTFAGDPKHWPFFMSAYIDTTEQCGFTDRENIARLGKSLRGEALEAVRADLMMPSSLPTALLTLRMLYGRPDLIFHSAVEQVKETPLVKMERLETLITFAMRVKSLCDIIRAAGMPHYLQNPSLLMELVRKLPTSLRMEWSKYRSRSEIEDPITTLDTFNQWLRSTAEVASSVTDEPTGPPTPKPNYDRSSERRRGQRSKAEFHAVHKEEDKRTAESTEDYCTLCKSKGHKLVNCRVFAKLPTVKKWNEVKRRHLCIGCFGKHFLSRCPSKRPCGVNNCVKPHNPLLHSNTTSVSQPGHSIPSQTPSSSSIDPVASTSAHEHVGTHHKLRDRAYLQIIPVTLYGKNGREVQTHAFLDGGSTVTLLEDRVAKELELDGEATQLRLKWTNDIIRDEPKSRKVTLQMSGQDGTRYWLRDIRTTEDLSLPIQTLDATDVNQFKFLNSLPIATYAHVQPRILIGLDHYQLMVPQETIEGSWHDPVAIRTRIGWTLLGGATMSKSRSLVVNTHRLDENRLHDLVSEFFSLESLGVAPPKKPVESLADARAKRILHETVRRLDDEGRYEAGLLWRTNDVTLPHSRGMATHRLLCFERKLKKFPMLADVVKSQIEDYISKGYLQKLTHEEAAIQSPRTWYLPIFAVSNVNKPNKIRLVWDAAAKVEGISLNSQLLTGPDLLSSLIGILFKFREHRHAISGDIRQMFHQVRIRLEDQDSQRCLWRLDGEMEPTTYRMTVMTFGATCSPTTSQYVKNLNAERYKSTHPRAVESIQNKHYVDDFIDSFDDIDECIAVTQQVVKIHQAGGFELRNFISNSPEVLRSLTHDPAVTEKSLADLSDGAKVLGIHWDTVDDTLRFRVNKQRMGQEFLEDNKIPTKRMVLAILMSIYDPLGLLGFFIVHGKLIIKEVWRSGVEWDDPVQPAEMYKWSDWVRAMSVIETVRVSRSYFRSRECTSEYELHTFVDAGKNAVAAVSYLVQQHRDGTREVAFAASKTKGTPSKTTAIPRLELQAAVIGARLANCVEAKHTIPIKLRKFWIDSVNVLWWIRSPKTFAPFVEFRIGEIFETTKKTEWSWVPTDINIADHATKWKLSKTRCIPSRWFAGPEFLSLPSHEWPKEREDMPVPTEDELEVKRVLTTHCVEPDHLVPDMSRYSSLNKLIRVQAYVLRVFYRRRLPTTQLSPEELDGALFYIIRSVQQSAFAKEYVTLKRNGKLEKNNILREYSPFLDEHFILRMQSRLKDASYLTFEQKNPIILPNGCRFTDLLISHYHSKYYHRNDGTVLNELHQLYAIPRLRSQLKLVRARCMRCRIRDARPNVPEMANLPSSRLAARMRPFTFTGVDYFGPITVKHGRRQEKKWGALFTCLTTRAIHLELASSLSTDAFILVLRCFISRRGQPREIFSDNGTNFRGAETELRKIVQGHIKDKVRESFSEVKWNFNPPSAPHMGGAWERLVRSVKIGLFYALPERSPSEDLLRCCLTEIEAMVNSRPLTYVELEDNSLEALTPNHFLLGSSGGLKPLSNFTDDVHILRSEWKKEQRITQQFWTRWILEYLPTISKRTKWFDPVVPLAVGDVVAVVTADTPYSWQLGRIVSITTSKDGNVRQAEVKTKSGVLRRPASKLAVLLRMQDELKEPDLPTGGSVEDGSCKNFVVTENF